jgi:hypothetical protein
VALFRVRSEKLQFLHDFRSLLQVYLNSDQS